MNNYTVIEHRVYYNETDQMARVYHSNYVLWMEKGRTEFIRECGFSYKSLEEKGIFLPVTSIKIEFYKSISYDSIIKIKTILENISRISVKFKYEFYDETMKILYGIGYSTNVFSGSNGPKRVSYELVDQIKNKK